MKVDLFKEQAMKVVASTLKPMKRVMNFFLVTLVFVIANTSCVMAKDPSPTGTGGDLASSKLVMGTKNLMNDAAMVGMILAPLIAVGLIIYFFIRKDAADEMDQKKWSSRIWVTVFCVVGVELAGMIIGLVTRYYA